MPAIRSAPRQRRHTGRTLLEVAAFAAIAVALAWLIVRGAGATDERLTGPVAIYMSVISLMVVMAFGTAVPIAIVGAVLFYASDGILGWNKFVEPVPHGRVAIMTTYHLGQIGLVLALAS